MINRGQAAATVWTRRLIALIGVALLAPAALAETALTPHKAEYKVKVSVLGGQLKTELKSTPGGYVATHVIRPTGLSRMLARGSISETSEFYSAADGLRPKAYLSEDTLSRDETSASIQFDWDAGEARGTVDGREVVSDMHEIAHDHVSIQYQLMHDMLHDGPSAQYTMFEIDELRAVSVRNVGARKVKVPAGKFDVIGLQHQAEGSKRRTTFWCAPALDYLPVIIEQHRLEKLKVRAVLSRYTPTADSQAAGLNQ